jgi:FAD/FMN-containing dehydrogenase
MNLVGTWPDPADTAANIDWVRATYDAVAPHSEAAPYINFMGDETSDRIRAAYRGDTYARLVAVKRQYDPENLFRLNQNIRPDQG